jgi:hypothetical protein
MHLHEIQITKDIKTQTLLQIIKKNGWYLLGEGKEGIVAEHPKREYVLKIWRKPSRYEWFVEFVRQNQSNPHVPVFSRYTAPIPGTDYLYTRMEKLKPILKEPLAKLYKPELIWLWAVGQTHGIDTITDSNEYMVKDWIYQYGIRIEPDTNVRDDLQDLWKKFGYPDASWLDISDKIVLAAKKHGIKRFDLHHENFMLRGQTLVITDPWF